MGCNVTNDRRGNGYRTRECGYRVFGQTANGTKRRERSFGLYFQRNYASYRKEVLFRKLYAACFRRKNLFQSRLLRMYRRKRQIVLGRGHAQRYYYIVDICGGVGCQSNAFLNEETDAIYFVAFRVDLVMCGKYVPYIGTRVLCLSCVLLRLTGNVSPTIHLVYLVSYFLLCIFNDIPTRRKL